MMGLRLVILAAVVAAAFGAVWLAGRSSRRSPAAGLGSGLVVVTGADCRWCDRLLAALAHRHPGRGVTIIDVRTAGEAGLTVRSVPTALVVGDEGRVIMRRTGPAAVADLDRLVEEAALLPPPRPTRR